MLFGKKKKNVIDRRIKELRKEMERVRGEIKTASRPGAAQSTMPTPRICATSAPVFGAKPPPDRTENDLFTQAARHSETGGAEAAGRPFAGDSGAPSLFDQPAASSSRLAEVGMREKFANYFMAGHFQNLRPLRQESRIIRNKAIVMVVLVLALILWLVYYLQTH
ncbi:MAG: hypothetical protein ABIH24_10795 [Verrucomicrobiota bacterium]